MSKSLGIEILKKLVETLRTRVFICMTFLQVYNSTFFPQYRSLCEHRSNTLLIFISGICKMQYCTGASFITKAEVTYKMEWKCMQNLKNKISRHSRYNNQCSYSATEQYDRSQTIVDFLFFYLIYNPIHLTNMATSLGNIDCSCTCVIRMLTF